MSTFHRSIACLAACGVAAVLTGCTSTGSFAKLDTNRDGTGSSAEFDAYMKKEVFTRVDTNGDAKVSKAEWQQFNPKAGGTRFSKADANGNGSIERPEADAAFDREGSLTRLFTRIDSDLSGDLSQAEVAAFHSKVRQQPASSPAEKISNAANQP